MQGKPYYVEARRDDSGGEIECFKQKTPPRALATAAHIHDAIELIYVTSGSFRVLRDDREHLLSAGDLILFSSNAIHHIIAGNDEENAYYVIKCSPSLLLGLSGEALGGRALLRFTVSDAVGHSLWTKDEIAGGAIEKALLEIIEEHQANQKFKEFALRLRITSLFLAILRDDRASEDDACVGTSRQEMNGILYEAVSYVRRNYASDIDERSLAESLNVSYSYFSRCFKRAVGKSFKEYLNRTRLDHAEQMLLTTSMSVTEVASACGYNNVSYFISLYHRHKGVTPLAAAKRFADLHPS